MENYLVFDAGCLKCSQIAEAIQHAAGDRLQFVSIRDSKASELLSKALPNGWEHRPYLVVVDQNGSRAWTGLQAALRLCRLMGPRKAWHVWSLARRLGISSSLKTQVPDFDASRRSYLKRVIWLAWGLTLLPLARWLSIPRPVYAQQCSYEYIGTWLWCYCTAATCNDDGCDSHRCWHSYREYCCDESGCWYTGNWQLVPVGSTCYADMCCPCPTISNSC